MNFLLDWLFRIGFFDVESRICIAALFILAALGASVSWKKTAIGIGLAVGFVFSYWLLTEYPGQKINAAQANAGDRGPLTLEVELEAIDRLQRTWAGALASIGGGLLIYVNWRRAVAVENQADAQFLQVQIALKVHISELQISAVKQLCAVIEVEGRWRPIIAQRSAAVIFLSQLAKNEPSTRYGISTTLSAYIGDELSQYDRTSRDQGVTQGLRFDLMEALYAVFDISDDSRIARPAFGSMMFHSLFLAGHGFGTFDLRNSDFDHSILVNTNFSQSRLDGTTFKESDISGADFTGATGLGQDQINSARCDPRNLPSLPNGLIPPSRAPVPIDRRELAGMTR